MKVSIEIDCTPQEAREVLGLPDVKALQDQWLEKTGAALLADPANFTPEALVQNWTRAAAPAFAAMPELFQSVLGAAMSGKSGK